MDKFYVIKVVNTGKAELRKWYRKREGEMFICRLNSERNGYITEGFVDNECSLGNIEPQFCKVLATFECEDDY